ncbi:hypothetical protein TWF481_007701 [Arthrobotrys musiformis]|uniref:F-box domain-containing protein n=1 Tax=Arthrobotrys musiformis TaxID=47236 RepID=A0AAV9WDJ1_9PEZI
MKILSLPTEILIQIIEYLPWLDHFTLSTVSPVFTLILQHNSFRRKRYCEEIWEHFKDLEGDVLQINFRRFNPDEVRYWPDGPGWRTELGLHGLLGSGRLLLKLEKGGKRTNLLTTGFRDTKNELESHLENLDPMMKALEDAWGAISTVDISLDLLAEDRQYLKGTELDAEASFERNRPRKDEEVDADSLRADYSHITTIDPSQGNVKGDLVEQALRTGKVSVFHMTGKYPQIFRIKRPIYIADEEFTDRLNSGTDMYWTIYVPWDGPGSSVKDIIDKLSEGFKKELLDQNEDTIGCWIKFCQYSFFPRPDGVDKVHPRWKIFLEVLVVKQGSIWGSGNSKIA